ncbi:MAG: hypothetical protein M1823_006300 [Watsoniomyces obsoletus]|nr:MAG: hypothetical protein M1823_006300 [Watsoniomyces obsoletus]
MPLTVKHLNADTTFLLTFQPAFPNSPAPSFRFVSPRTPTTPRTPSPTSTASFSILLDPWLTGSTSIIHPKFARSQHRVPPCISSLRDISPPDLVIISQSKSDHCHEATLRQLPGDINSKTRILAHPTAAKVIRRWRHFPPEHIQSLRRYDPRSTHRESTIHRIILPPLSYDGAPGEVTVTLMASPTDITGVHTAIGITYRPPTSTAVLVPFSATPVHLLPPTPPPDSPRSFHSVSMSSYTAPSDRPISLIYSPHGVPYASVIEPYARTHLVAEAALPLDVLFHSFDRVQNWWWLGGTIAAGVPGGAEIARSLLAKYWISAHDEEKEVGGVSTKPVKRKRYATEEAQDLMMAADGGDLHRKEGGKDKSGGNAMDTEMVTLEPGEELHV